MNKNALPALLAPLGFLFGLAPMAAAPPAGPSGPSGTAAPSASEEPVEPQTYIYQSLDRRDPFKSLLVREPNRPGQRPPGIAGLSVDEIELEGLWKVRAGWVAQIKAADNRSYLLRKGDVLYDGEVLDIQGNELILRQNVNDPQSVKPFRDVVKRLNPETTP